VVCGGQFGENDVWTMRVARDWRWQLVQWVQPAGVGCAGESGSHCDHSSGRGAGESGCGAGEGIVDNGDGAEVAGDMGLVGRALVTGQPWLEMRLRQETRAVWPRVVMVMDSECHRWVTGHCRSFQRLPGGTVHRAELA
jgi:hypothetical protein